MILPISAAEENFIAQECQCCSINQIQSINTVKLCWDKAFELTKKLSSDTGLYSIKLLSLNNFQHILNHMSNWKPISRIALRQSPQEKRLSWIPQSYYLKFQLKDIRERLVSLSILTLYCFQIDKTKKW